MIVYDGIKSDETSPAAFEPAYAPVLSSQGLVNDLSVCAEATIVDMDLYISIGMPSSDFICLVCFGLQLSFQFLHSLLIPLLSFLSSCCADSLLVFFDIGLGLF
jgi:hypothetical protein